jgi:hypothetical protein
MEMSMVLPSPEVELAKSWSLVAGIQQKLYFQDRTNVLDGRGQGCRCSRVTWDARVQTSGTLSKEPDCRGLALGLLPPMSALPWQI